MVAPSTAEGMVAASAIVTAIGMRRIRPGSACMLERGAAPVPREEAVPPVSIVAQLSGQTPSRSSYLHRPRCRSARALPRWVGTEAPQAFAPPTACRIVEYTPRGRRPRETAPRPLRLLALAHPKALEAAQRGPHRGVDHRQHRGVGHREGDGAPVSA